MRVGRFLSEGDYISRLNDAVKEFQRKTASPWIAPRKTEYQVIYAAIAAREPVPVSRGELGPMLYPDWRQMSWRIRATINLHLHARLQSLTNRGLLYECGRRTSPYFTRPASGKYTPPTSMTYRAVLAPNIGRFELARRKLYREVTFLNEWRDRSAALMAQVEAMPHTSRDHIIVGLRKEGFTLKQIGEHFGLTRERVRQILSVEMIVNERSNGSENHSSDAASMAETTAPDRPGPSGGDRGSHCAVARDQCGAGNFPGEPTRGISAPQSTPTSLIGLARK